MPPRSEPKFSSRSAIHLSGRARGAIDHTRPRRTGKANVQRPRCIDFQLESGMEQHRPCAVALGKEHEIGRADLACHPAGDRRHAIGLQGLSRLISAHAAASLQAPPRHRPQRPACLADDGTDDGNATWRAVARQDCRTDERSPSTAPWVSFVERCRRDRPERCSRLRSPATARRPGGLLRVSRCRRRRRHRRQGRCSARPRRSLPWPPCTDASP